LLSDVSIILSELGVFSVVPFVLSMPSDFDELSDDSIMFSMLPELIGIVGGGARPQYPLTVTSFRVNV
jgi:hypothetical protein